jgi:hypothetical protein
MQVKVPKFIEIEDKIISFAGIGITWKQFLALMLGFGGGFLATKIFIAGIGIPLMLISVILGAAIAFGRVNDRPFITYLGAAWRFFYNPHAYVWKQVPSRVNVSLKEKADASDADKKPKETVTAENVETKLSDIAKLLDK